MNNESLRKVSALAHGRYHQRLHFTGIGGSGMSGLAEVFLTLGYQVSGSDLQASDSTRRLQRLGAHISHQHDRQQVLGVDVLVTSAAIGDDNPELQEARCRRIPVLSRAAMLAELMRFRYGIAVAGSHGKTTTTSLIAMVFAEAGLDPTYVIGGRLLQSGDNARLGSGDYLVAEADESDASFLCLQPMMAVVTNIDDDHLVAYGNSRQRLNAGFQEFLQHLPFYGCAILCTDDATVRGLLAQLPRSVISYGIVQEADWQAENIQVDGLGSRFLLRHRGQLLDLEMHLNLPGRHNVCNALAAIAVAREHGIEFAVIQRALSRFHGIGRRFEVVHENWPWQGGTVLFVDDYAHHPSELAAVLEAVRQSWPKRRLILLFQPHRYSRLQDLFARFIAVLASADRLLLSPVYSAGEAARCGFDHHSLACAVHATRQREQPIVVDALEQLPQALLTILQADDVVLTAGAGSIGALARTLPSTLEALS